MEQIFLVQEDKGLEKIILNYLQTTFKVQSIPSVCQAYKLLDKNIFDLVILDLNSKTGNSIELCKAVKKALPSSKVIMLSGNATINTKELCFENGTDDFLTKPFVPKEMLLRINALLGKYAHKEESYIQHKNLQLHKVHQTLEINHCKVYLSFSEYLILEYLLTNKDNRGVEKMISYISLRKDKQITNSALTVQVNRLRNKLEKAVGMQIIKTRYGKGYYLGL